MQADDGAAIDFTFDGRRVTARPGQSVAMALWDAGVRAFRDSPLDAAPRGVFCAIGICQECVVVIDGVRRPACTTLAQPALNVLPARARSTGSDP
ncbi:MAG TPA: (2Fe-2S)-binding protein [Casimicrobiaceae bacterium]|nr:(2Fe-2S)-binding protein [Casimicrobiaceae bacterium]